MRDPITPSPLLPMVEPELEAGRPQAPEQWQYAI